MRDMYRLREAVEKQELANSTGTLDDTWKGGTVLSYIGRMLRVIC